VPGAGFAGIAGVESGKAAPLVGGPPGVELHTVVEGLPSGDAGGAVPVVLPTIDVGMVPNGVAGIIAVDDIVVVDVDVVAIVPGMDVETVLDTIDGVGTSGAVMEGDGRAGTAGGGGAGTVEPGKKDANDVPGCADNARNGAVVPPVVDVEEIAGTAGSVGAADVEGGVPVVPLVADMALAATVGVPGAICPVGVEQVTTVPAVVGSDASGTGASVVSAVPGWVVAENGLGPLSGEVTIAPGVNERPMAVLPIVETCARQAVQPASMVAIVNSKRRIGIARSATV
jgi:hypothetical protein